MANRFLPFFKQNNPHLSRLCIWLMALYAFCGCASNDVDTVNMAAAAYRCSMSDTESRQLAIDTLPKIVRLTKDYKVGPDDVLSFTVFEWMVRDESLTIDVIVSETGQVTLPLIGQISVMDSSIPDIEQMVVEKLVSGGFIKQPRVNVFIKEFRSKTISVVGAVVNPGRFNIRQNVVTLLDILAQAGGRSELAGYVVYIVQPEFATGGDPESVDVTQYFNDATIAGNKKVIAIDMIELLHEGNLNLNVVLEDGDMVYVPEAPQFYVVGYVRKPGGFALKRPTTILDGIALAEGLINKEASPRKCVLKRKLPSGEIVIPIDLVSISEGLAPNLYLLSNDIIDVRQTAAKGLFIEVVDFLKGLFTFGYNLADL